MEENKYYQIYTDSILNLAGSLVLKSSAAASGVNQMVYTNSLAPYDELDPTTWKYYQNICGIYYPSDTHMYVTSMDTLEEILFSKETLVFHRATARAYAFGTTYYKELVARYQDQEQLIRGILYPADMTAAVEAKDGYIITYPKEFVEETEPSFIPMLQEWIYGFLSRWHNVQYANIDNLYTAAMLGVLYSALPAAIENIRMRLCRTNEAHSYHVREFLSSNSKLGQFLPYMTRSQAMYFYRNLRYIETNSGSNAVLDELIYRCMTQRNLPIAHFTMFHTTEHMPQEITPQAIFYKDPLNTPGNINNRYYYTLKDIFDVEEPMAIGNERYRDEEERLAQTLTENTLTPVVPTKLLQSTVVDYTDSERYRIADIVLNHWVWFASQDVYKAYVTFTVPATGVNISLSAKDAFVFYAYALVRGYGYLMDKPPRVMANRVQRMPRPTLASLQEMVPKRMHGDPRLAEFIASTPSVTPMISLEAFRKHCEELFKASNLHYFMTAAEESMDARAYLEGASLRVWSDQVIDLAEHPEQTYAQWFADRNLVVNEYSQVQLAEIAHVILKEAVGENLASRITLKDIQNAMCSIILRLSSYSIQLDKSINNGPVIDAGQIQVRMDNFTQTGQGLHYLEVPTVDPEKVIVQGTHHLEILANPFVDIEVTAKADTDYRVFDLPGMRYTASPNSVKTFYRVPIGVALGVNIGEIQSNPRNLTVVSGMEHFLKLPLEQQLESYVDTWAR